MKFWDITSSTNRRGDQENTSNEKPKQEVAKCFCTKSVSCLHQECTQMGRDHCSPHFRKELHQEPLWLGEREAANGKCLSAESSDMGL